MGVMVWRVWGGLWRPQDGTFNNMLMHSSSPRMVAGSQLSSFASEVTDDSPPFSGKSGGAAGEGGGEGGGGGGGE